MNNVKMNKKYYIHSLIIILLMACTRFLPPVGGMTPLGMHILGIFLGALWGWVNVDMIWPSALAMIMLGFSGYVDNVAAAFNLAFSNTVVHQILWLLIMSALLKVSGLAAWLANTLISVKALKSRPWMLSAIIIMIAYICAAFQCGFAGLLLCWNFIYAICEQTGIPKHTKWPNMMIMSCVFAGCMGSSVMPYYSGTVATYGYLTTASAGVITYNYMSHVTFGLLYSLAIMAVYFLLCRLIVRPDMTPFRKELNLGEKKPLDTNQKIVIAMIFGMVLCLLLPSCLPGTAVAAFFNKIGTGAIVLSTICVAIFLRNADGKPYFTFKQLSDAGLMWPMVFMVATAMTLGSALVSGDTGVKEMFTHILIPLFAGKSAYFFACVFAVSALILTNFINNAVVGAIMIPIMYAISADVGVNPVAMCALICFTSNIGLILPNACPYAAMVHGNKEWITSGAIAKQALVAILAVTLVTCILGVPLANALM